MEHQVQIYTGDGKGKTTAAIGLAMRAAGHGKRTYLGQFMKGCDYGELHTLAKIPEIEIVQFGWDACIRREEVTDFHRGKSAEGLSRCEQAARSGDFELLILDEACVALWFGLLEETALLDFIARYRASHEIILTGRRASDALLKQADLITRMECECHYFDHGVAAREGIEW